MSVAYVVDGETYADSTYMNTLVDAINNGTADVYNVLNYDAAGDGTTDDTDALAEAFAAADGNGVVYLPPGTYLTDTIIWRGQSVIGAGSNLTTIKGKPSQDVVRCHATADESRQYMTLRGFRVVVDDSVDASASFSNRGGVGNAGFAQDFPDANEDDPPYSPNFHKWQDVTFWGLSETVGGQNNSCGIYEQFRLSNAASYRDLLFYRLEYGWWQDAPDNVASIELARDHVSGNTLHFNGCGDSLQFTNCLAWNIDYLTFHSTSNTAIAFVGVQSSARNANHLIDIRNLVIDVATDAFSWSGDAWNLSVQTALILVEDAVEWAAHISDVTNLHMHLDTDLATPLIVSGDRNFIEFSTNGAAYDAALVSETGSGNKVWITKFHNDAGAVSARILVSEIP
jgi:hypothetical protein